MTSNSKLKELYRSVLPPVRTSMLEQLPRTLYGYVRQVSWHQQVRLSFLTFLVFPLTLTPLELQRRMVDNAVGNSDVRLLLILGGVYLAVLLAHGGLKYLRNIYQERTAEGVSRLIRRRVIHQASSTTDLEDGTEQSIIAAEAEKMGGFVAESIAFPLLQAGIIVSVGIYMLVVQPIIAAVALAFLIPSVIATVVIQPVLNKLSEKKVVATRELGENVLQVGHGTAPEETDSDSLTEKIYRLRLRFAYFKHAMKTLNNFFSALGPLSVLVVGGWLAINGETQIGTIVAFISGYERMTDPVRELLTFYRQMSVMRVQYNLLFQATEGSQDA